MNDKLFYIDNYYLDQYQIDCIKCNKNLLVVAGAGCGKTSTIIGKVKYLKSIGYMENEILCISLTNEATNGLKKKLNNIGINVDCYTFHKLGLNIIKRYIDIKIIDDDYLEYIVNEYFHSIVMNSYRKYLLLIIFGTINKIILNSNKFNMYKKTIIMFIRLLKNKGYGIDYIYSLYKKSIIKHTYFFLLEIYRLYEIELNSTNSIDMCDMITLATKLVINNRLNLGYKYIIIDEYQDTSIVRLNLIKAINEYSDSKIMCVGDDYQSIYRFAGSDITLFLDFHKHFCNSEIKYLKNTYRNSQELLNISNRFICKNKYQFKKKLFSSKHIDKPIKMVFVRNKVIGLKQVINSIGSNYMIIGRNNKDINNYVDNYGDINNINYMTAHKSKGLEFDNIIIINLTDNIMGFPSKLKNNKIIDTLFDKELYPYDEERRLFYVALTRTKNNVYLIIERKNISIFVKELIKDYRKYIEFIYY